MKFIHPTLLKSFLLGMLSILFVACEDDEEEPTPGNISLSAANASLSAVRGNSVTPRYLS